MSEKRPVNSVDKSVENRLVPTLKITPKQFLLLVAFGLTMATVEACKAVLFFQAWGVQP